MESAMRTGSLGLLVLLMAGALAADARAQSAASAPTGKEEGAANKGPVADKPSVVPPAASCPAPGQPGAYPSWPGNEWPLMPKAEGAGAAQTPPGQQATADGSTGQAPQQQQQ